MDVNLHVGLRFCQRTERRTAYGYQCIFLRKRFFCMSQCLLVLADRCVMQFYQRKLPVVFDILNGHHEHELGTFTFFPFPIPGSSVRSLLALGRSLLQRKHFGSDFDIFLHKLINSTSCNYCIPECNFFSTQIPQTFPPPSETSAARD